MYFFNHAGREIEKLEVSNPQTRNRERVQGGRVRVKTGSRVAIILTSTCTQVNGMFVHEMVEELEKRGIYPSDRSF